MQASSNGPFVCKAKGADDGQSAMVQRINPATDFYEMKFRELRATERMQAGRFKEGCAALTNHQRQAEIRSKRQGQQHRGRRRDKNRGEKRIKWRGWGVLAAMGLRTERNTEPGGRGTLTVKTKEFGPEASGCRGDGESERRMQGSMLLVFVHFVGGLERDEVKPCTFDSLQRFHTQVREEVP